MSGSLKLGITLELPDGTVLVSERVDLDTLGSLYAEFGYRPGGFTSQRFLDTVQALFLRGARAPKIEVGGHHHRE